MDSPSYRISLPFLDAADAEAARLGQPFIAPEHLLLAVAANAQGASKTFFAQHGLTIVTLRAAVEAFHGTWPAAAEPQVPRTIALRSLRALAHAIGSADRGVKFTADNLLAALLSDDVAPGAVIGAILERFGMTATAARDEFAALRAAELERAGVAPPTVTLGDLQRELERVQVDMHSARARWRQIEPPVVRPTSDSEHHEEHTIDVTALMQTLRALPDGAGTDAFLSAYAARQQGRA